MKVTFFQGKLTALKKVSWEIIWRKKEWKGESFLYNSCEIFFGDHPTKKGWDNMELGKWKATQIDLHWFGNLRLFVCSHFLLLVLPRIPLLYFTVLFTLLSIFGIENNFKKLLFTMKSLPLFHIPLWITGPRKYFYHGFLILVYNHIHLKYCPGSSLLPTWKRRNFIV